MIDQLKMKFAHSASECESASFSLIDARSIVRDLFVAKEWICWVDFLTTLKATEPKKGVRNHGYGQLHTRHAFVGNTTTLHFSTKNVAGPQSGGDRPRACSLRPCGCGGLDRIHEVH